MIVSYTVSKAALGWTDTSEAAIHMYLCPPFAGKMGEISHWTQQQRRMEWGIKPAILWLNGRTRTSCPIVAPFGLWPSKKAFL